MSPQVLAAGPPTLTEEAADAAAQLPYMLQMLAPVLAASGEQLNPAVQPDVQIDPELAATEQLFNHSMMSTTLEAGSTSMTTATIDLMHAMSGSS